MGSCALTYVGKSGILWHHDNLYLSNVAVFNQKIISFEFEKKACAKNQFCSVRAVKFKKRESLRKCRNRTQIWKRFGCECCLTSLKIVFVNSAKMLTEILSSKVSNWSGWCPQFVEFVFSDNFYCANKETWLTNIRYCAVKSVEILMTKIPPTSNSKVSKIWSGNLVKITWQMCCAISWKNFAK